MDTQQIDTLQGSELDLAVYNALYPGTPIKWLYQSEDEDGDTIYIEEKKHDWSKLVPCYHDEDFIPPYNWKRIPKYHRDIYYAWQVHKKACEEIFSKRQKYLELLTNEIRGRHNLLIAWPDILVFIEPFDFCRAFLKAQDKS